jgi:hypothetical protein
MGQVEDIFQGEDHGHILGIHLDLYYSSLAVPGELFHTDRNNFFSVEEYHFQEYPLGGA